MKFNDGLSVVRSLRDGVTRLVVSGKLTSIVSQDDNRSPSPDGTLHAFIQNFQTCCSRQESSRNITSRVKFQQQTQFSGHSQIK
jgi:hypothetical protein